MVKFHFVSIPYGKGKVKETKSQAAARRVSIPYGKGKDKVVKSFYKQLKVGINSLWER